MKSLFTPLFILLGFIPFYAQEVIPISWAELEEKGLENNLQIQKAENESALAKAEVLKARALFLPNVELSYTFMNTNNPMMAFGTKLNQERIGQEDFNPSFLNSPSSISDFSTRIEVQQPLINIDGFLEKKAGKTKAQAMDFQKERSVEYMQFEFKKAYMMLQLAYQVKNTLEEAKRTTLANQKVVKKYYENGMIQKPDVLDVAVRLREIENQLQEAESNIANASDYVFLLLNEDNKGRILKPQDELDYHEIITERNPELDIDRKDLQAYQKSVEAYDYMIKSSTTAYLPRLNAFGSYELHEKEIAQFRNNSYMVGVQLSWSVFDGLKANSDKRKYKAEKEKAKTEIKEYTQKSQLELNQAYRKLRDADNTVQLMAKAVEQLEESYRIRKNRYEEGLEKSSDLLMAETNRSQKKLEYQQAVFEYNTAKAYYEFLK